MFVSIVIPTHNEEGNVLTLFERIRSVLQEIGRDDWEVIFVDDSTDDTAEIISDLNQTWPNVKLIHLTRSFGQAVAVAAGLKRSSGKCVVIMDADLQDPPEAIPQLISKWESGAKVVYVERPSETRSILYKILATSFYRILQKIATVPIPVDAGEFRLLDRRVVDFMNQLSEHSRFIRGLTIWPGYQIDKITLSRANRLAGETKYNFRRSFSIAIDGIVSFSVMPLRLTMICGFILSLVSFILALAYFVAWVMDLATFSPGWTSLFLSIVFIGGANLFCIGMVGEYVGRAFIELQNRPLYLVDYELGFQKGDCKSDRMTPLSSPRSECDTAD